MRCALIHLASSVHKKATTPPISSGKPTRPKAVFEAIPAFICSLSRTTPPKRSYMISVYVLSAFSAATDIIMAIVPVFILRRLEIDRRTKVAAGVTMGLGSL